MLLLSLYLMDFATGEKLVKILVLLRIQYIFKICHMPKESFCLSLWPSYVFFFSQQVDKDAITELG